MCVVGAVGRITVSCMLHVVMLITIMYYYFNKENTGARVKPE